MKRRRFLGAALAGTVQALARVRGAPRTRAGTRRRIVIAGAGFAGAACALRLRRSDPALDVVLVDPDETYVTCPMSNEVIAGWRSLDSITLSRSGLRQAGVEVVRAQVSDIEPGKGRVRLDDGRVLQFDRLVAAPGIRFIWGRVEGYDAFAARRMPHAWKAGEQTALLAAQLRAMQDGGVVAIAVPSGLMRCPPGPYERATLIAHYLVRHKPRSKVLIFDANNHFPRQEEFTRVWRTLYPGKVEWIASTQGGEVVRVDAQNMMLHTRAGAQRAAVANIIPAQAPGQLAIDSGLSAGHGWCPVDPLTFESRNLERVHVIGDACIADAMPKSASAAVSQAGQCASAILALLAGREAPVPDLRSVCYGMLAPARALAIDARFELKGGKIVARPSVAVDENGAPADRASRDEAAAAARWYVRTREEAFAA